MNKLKHIHLVKRWNKLSDTNRLFVAIAALVIIVGGLIGWAQYQDWRNEQLLRNIAADFARLETDLESELGVDVENKSGCFTTQEKYGDGKTGCFMRLETDRELNYDQTIITEQISKTLNNTNVSKFREGGYGAEYMKLKCLIIFDSFGYDTTFYTECPVPVRAGNSSLVSEIL